MHTVARCLCLHRIKRVVLWVNNKSRRRCFMKLLLRSGALMLTMLACASLAVGYQVYGAIGEKWNSLGGANGFLGAPLNDETGTPDGRGRYNHFQGGSIYWTQETGAHEVHGMIREKWASMGWERSSLGYPI